MNSNKQLYLNSGIALLEATLLLSISLVAIVIVAGVVQKLNLFQELNSQLENQLVVIESNRNKLDLIKAVSLSSEDLKVHIENKILGDYLIESSVNNYSSSLQTEFVKLLGNLSAINHPSYNSNEQIINTLLSSEESSVSTLKYQNYQANKYLEPSISNLQETKFVIFRLLLKPKNQLLNFLEYFGIDSSLYFEKVLTINNEYSELIL